MKILIACEYSGTVRDAFRALGHDAISCDLLPTDVPGPHHQGDVAELLTQQWDMLIAFPPCTYLCSSGMHWTVRGKRDPQLTEDALAFVQSLLGADVKHIALENPVGCISTRIRKPDCITHPWEHGHPESKTTCLWLKNLPKLTPTNILQKPATGRWKNQCANGSQNKLPPSPGQVEAAEQDLSGNCERNGEPMERIRIVSAWELPECDCCGEPWCTVHVEYYADCECVGPSNAEDEGWELEERDGFLYGIRPMPS